MKKTLIIAAALALGFPAFISCEDGLKPGGDDSKEVVFDEPAKKADAVKVEIPSTVISDPSTAPVDKQGNTYKSFEVTESGIMVIEKITPEKEPIYVVGEVKDIERNIKHDDYPGMTGTRFISDVYGSVTVLTPTRAENVIILFAPKDNNGVVTSSSGNKSTTVNTGSNKTDSDNFCRSWVVTKTIVSVTGTGITASVGTFFDGNFKAPEVAEWINKNVATVKDLSIFTGYNLDYVTFTEAGTAMVNFQGNAKDPFVGSWKSTGDKKINITYDHPDVNKYVPSGVAGTYEFVSVNGVKMCILKVNASVSTDSGSSYSAFVELRMTAK